jgi:hypothetical protein
MIYGSGAGPNTITNSNLRDTAWNIDFDNPPGPNGAVTINGNFFVFPNYDPTKPPGTATNNPGVRGMPTGTTIAGSLTKAVANAQPR